MPQIPTLGRFCRLGEGWALLAVQPEFLIVYLEQALEMGWSSEIPPITLEAGGVQGLWGTYTPLPAADSLLYFP